MYLFVFVFLMLSLVGIYTQIYITRVGVLDSKQRAAADLMQAWHDGAYEAGRDTDSTAITATGCSLTNGYLTSGSGAKPCLKTGVPRYVGNGTFPDLPSGYQLTYTWRSVAYKDSTTSKNYVITIVPPPGTSDGLITDPPIGMPLGELYNQLSKTGLPATAYGLTTQTGTNIILRTKGAKLNGTTYDFEYQNLPSDAPVGSLVIISGL
jgi:hypothetical protein